MGKTKNWRSFLLGSLSLPGVEWAVGHSWGLLQFLSLPTIPPGVVCGLRPGCPH
jgi:hypothetical protein